MSYILALSAQFVIRLLLLLSQPKAVFFTCMDSRMIPTRFTETNVGDMFVGTIYYSSIISQSHVTASFNSSDIIVMHFLSFFSNTLLTSEISGRDSTFIRCNNPNFTYMYSYQKFLIGFYLKSGKPRERIYPNQYLLF